MTATLTTYAGESLAKRAGRLMLYRAVMEKIDAVGNVVGLVGHGCELEAMAEVASVTRGRVCAIDHDATAARYCRSGEFVCADLSAWIATQPRGSIAFCHADLMGQPDRLMPIAIALASKLADGGVFAATFLRGRDGKIIQDRRWKRLLATRSARRTGPLSGYVANEAARIRASSSASHARELLVEGLVTGWLGSGFDHSSICSIRYDSGSSPMQTLAWSRGRGTWRDGLQGLDFSDDDAGNREFLLKWCDAFGEDARRLSGTPTAQLAAWRAVRTRESGRG